MKVEETKQRFVNNYIDLLFTEALLKWKRSVREIIPKTS